MQRREVEDEAVDDEGAGSVAAGKENVEGWLVKSTRSADGRGRSITSLKIHVVSTRTGNGDEENQAPMPSRMNSSRQAVTAHIEHDDAEIGGVPLPSRGDALPAPLSISWTRWASRDVPGKCRSPGEDASDEKDGESGQPGQDELRSRVHRTMIDAATQRLSCFRELRIRSSLRLANRIRGLSSRLRPCRHVRHVPGRCAACATHPGGRQRTGRAAPQLGGGLRRSGLVVLVCAVTLACCCSSATAWVRHSIIAVPFRVLTTWILKEVIERPRPSADLVEFTSQPSTFSFPSGHAAGAFVVYGLVFYFATLHVQNLVAKRVIQAICVVLIVGAGLERVYVGHHWPSDVLGGYWHGALIVAAAIAIHQMLRRIRLEVTSGHPLRLHVRRHSPEQALGRPHET